MGSLAGYAGDRMISRRSIVMALALAVVCAGCAPAVSHQIESTSVESCRSCHQTGASAAPVVSHADRETCLNCHDSKSEPER